MYKGLLFAAALSLLSLEATPQVLFMGVPLGGDAYSMVAPLARKGLKFEGVVGNEALSFSGEFAGWDSDYIYVHFAPGVERSAHEALVGFESGGEPAGWEPKSMTVFSDLRDMLLEKYPTDVSEDSSHLVVGVPGGSISLSVDSSRCVISYVDSVAYRSMRALERSKNLEDL